MSDGMNERAAAEAQCFTCQYGPWIRSRLLNVWKRDCVECGASEVSTTEPKSYAQEDGGLVRRRCMICGPCCANVKNHAAVHVEAG